MCASPSFPLSPILPKKHTESHFPGAKYKWEWYICVTKRSFPHRERKWVHAAPKTRSLDKSDRPAAHTTEPCVPPAYQTNNCASARPLNVPSQVDQRGAAPRGAQQPRCLRRLRARPVVWRCSAVIVGLSRGRRCTGGGCARCFGHAAHLSRVVVDWQVDHPPARYMNMLK